MGVGHPGRRISSQPTCEKTSPRIKTHVIFALALSDLMLWDCSDVLVANFHNFLRHCTTVIENKIENDVVFFMFKASNNLQFPTFSLSSLLSSANILYVNCKNKMHVASTQIINSKWSKNTNFWEDNRTHLTYISHHICSPSCSLQRYATPTA